MLYPCVSNWVKSPPPWALLASHFFTFGSVKSIVLEAISLYNCNERRRRRTSNQVCNLCACCVLWGRGSGFAWPYVEMRRRWCTSLFFCWSTYTNICNYYYKTVNNQRAPTTGGKPPLAASPMPTLSPIGTRQLIASTVWKFPRSCFVVFMHMVSRNHLLFNKGLLSLPCWEGI